MSKQVYLPLLIFFVGFIFIVLGFKQAYNMSIRVDGSQPDYLIVLAIQSTSFSKVITSLGCVIIGSIFITSFANQNRKRLYYFGLIYFPLTIFSLIKISGGNKNFGNIFYYPDPGEIVVSNIQHYYTIFIWSLLLVPVLFWLPKVLKSLLSSGD
jgi:hypothetical protein